eukprot:scaffold1382_cov429-Prasinococcus_capsulatus_cf.AAC.7
MSKSSTFPPLVALVTALLLIALEDLGAEALFHIPKGESDFSCQHLGHEIAECDLCSHKWLFVLSAGRSGRYKRQWISARSSCHVPSSITP